MMAPHTILLCRTDTACGIRLPDPKLPEYMEEIVPMSNHRMLYALDGNPLNASPSGR